MLLDSMAACQYRFPSTGASFPNFLTLLYTALVMVISIIRRGRGVAYQSVCTCTASKLPELRVRVGRAALLLSDVLC